MTEYVRQLHEVTALEFATAITGSRRLAIDITVDQTRDLAEAFIQQAQTLKIQNDQLIALCNELDAIEKKAKEPQNDQHSDN